MFYLPEDSFPYFPHPTLAESDGLLAFGGALNADWLLTAYRFGIFPWFNENDPILWWFLSPRLVLKPGQVKIQKSMRSMLSNPKYRVTYDTAFSTVMQACADVKRSNQSSTWINNDMLIAYQKLHGLGYAHSVEVWQNDDLVGGLYGLAIGKMFYGESMFSMTSNASKYAFIHLCKRLESKDFCLIDCQQDTAHLRSLGADLISRDDFLVELKQNMLRPDDAGKWIANICL